MSPSALAICGKINHLAANIAEVSDGWLNHCGMVRDSDYAPVL